MKKVNSETTIKVVAFIFLAVCAAAIVIDVLTNGSNLN